MKHHTPAEITAALVQAADREKQGRTQQQICAELDISVMTLHRWRHEAELETISPEFLNVKLENTRLRRIVADLMLEKTALEDKVHALSSPRLSSTG